MLDLPPATPVVPGPLEAELPLRTAVSRRRDPRGAARELAGALRHAELGFVLFFCSAEYPLAALSTALNEAFEGVAVAGCTTAGEITPEGYGRGCIVAIGLDRRHFAVSCALVEDLSGFDLIRAQRLVDGLLDDCRGRALAPVGEHSFALTLLDGLSSCEEQVLATLDAALGRIPSFGGSAGDDNRLAHTHVHAEGRFHGQAAVVVMINTRLPFEVFTTHHLRPRDEKLVVTRADRERRRVLELNALPAAEEYARLVGLPVEALEPEVFARHPLAVRLGEAHFVRSIQRVNDDGSLSFYCAVENGIVLTAMQPAPLLEDLEAVFAGLTARLGEPALIIGCDCFLRRLELEALGLVAPASRLLGRSRVIGFNTYGEQHHGMHINQTFTGVAIGSRPVTGDA
ncbi:nitric oxide-sensing protein NosP [Halomonas rhizosphaerae]|uniref:Nitric oxide-sensing protein NosP n=1 Tax=Halomonas rhizosphaerae TaxID=3043296 RepID=A0ABT6V5B5_9GAMM|nr:nitric oxide-sensing protein NosP [Halomonas rhizosphaerae]MDI5892698.1 nitric oxide-sensing protein NosP [Halomonas rhizosphaerae]MDI5921383.1 nitric oxide-sensing protein NosP [Halomonas rhizosphaerae]